MELKQKSAIIIPTRYASTRLPAKFKADIAGKPMLAHVLERVKESGHTNIYLACDHDECGEIADKLNIEVIMTDVSHANGTERIFEAVKKLEQQGKNFSYIVNMQGDMPFFDHNAIDKVLHLVAQEGIDMGTLAVKIAVDKDFYNEHVVKIALTKDNRALYFSRSAIPHSSSFYYRHVGIYSFKRHALAKYVSFPHSELEITERLEQLRALENNMQIKVDFIDTMPISIDVNEDLEKARIYASNL